MFVHDTHREQNRCLDHVVSQLFHKPRLVAMYDEEIRYAVTIGLLL